MAFDKFIVTEQWQADAKQAAIDYSNNPDVNWFFAGGQNGSGKTHICTAIAGKFFFFF
jgi:chromosomal replication initiation ATPase DnaA